MAAGLEHETPSNPIVILYKVLALFAHICALQISAAANHDANRITASVSINAKKSAT